MKYCNFEHSTQDGGNQPLCRQSQCLFVMSFIPFVLIITCWSSFIYLNLINLSHFDQRHQKVVVKASHYLHAYAPVGTWRAWVARWRDSFMQGHFCIEDISLFSHLLCWRLHLPHKNRSRIKKSNRQYWNCCPCLRHLRFIWEFLQ